MAIRDALVLQLCCGVESMSYACFKFAVESAFDITNIKDFKYTCGDQRNSDFQLLLSDNGNRTLACCAITSRSALDVLRKVLCELRHWLVRPRVRDPLFAAVPTQSHITFVNFGDTTIVKRVPKAYVAEEDADSDSDSDDLVSCFFANGSKRVHTSPRDPLALHFHQQFRSLMWFDFLPNRGFSFRMM